MRDLDDNPFDPFADAVEECLMGMREEIRSLRSELETRAATPQIDMGKLESVVREEMARVEYSTPPGKDGKDGRGIAAASMRDGKLFLRMTDDTEQEVGAVVGPAGKDGAPGERGADGAPSTVAGPPGERGERGSDSIVPGPQGERGMPGERGSDSTIPGPQGERGADGIATREELDALIEKRFGELTVRTLADSWRGVWTPDTLHSRGSVAQWDGSPWLAIEDTKAKPGTSPDWVLFAKKGRDGRK